MRWLAQPAIALVYAYRFAISPWLGVNCRFQPSCSEYAIIALRQHGLLRGSELAIKRIARCHPWGASGYDPVPGSGASQSAADDKTSVVDRD